MRRRRHTRASLALGFVSAALLAAPAPAPAGEKFTKDFMFEECDGFSSSGSHPFLVLEPGAELTLAGKDEGDEVELVVEVLDETETVDGVETRVVRETETANGKLVEISRNFFAICNRDNSVAYFGEEVDIYNKKGEIVSHEGAWRAGDDGAKPGIIMPGTVLLGARYFQERAPDVALDRAEIVSLSQTVETDAGTFEDCLKTEETTPLEKGVSIKKYARGIGLVQDDFLKLVDFDV